MAYVAPTTTFINHMHMRLSNIFIGINTFSKSITRPDDCDGYRCSGKIVKHRVLQGRGKTEA